MTAFFLLAGLLLSQNPAVFSADFTLSTSITDSKTTREVVRGNLYSLENSMLIFEVSSPVNQLMWIKKDTVDIYYPEEKKLFRILTRDTLPTANTSVSHFLSYDLEYRLHRAGFVTLKAIYKGDTVFHYWEKKGFPEIVTGSVEDDLVLYRSSGRGWSLEFKTWDYRQVEGKRYPHFLRSTVTKGRVKRVEELRLANIQLNRPLPGHLAASNIPGDTEVKIVEW